MSNVCSIQTVDGVKLQDWSVIRKRFDSNLGVYRKERPGQFVYLEHLLQLLLSSPITKMWGNYGKPQELSTKSP